ncbi:hypothetical protein JCM14469_24960 [Desulfatiferula olefinivorans]
MIDIIRRLIVSGLALGVIAGNADQITEFFDDTVLQARLLATAADLRSIGLMLDHHFLKRGRYPRDADFLAWMARTFKENPVHTLGLDHWERPLIYENRLSGKGFVLKSTGPDGLADTSDDMIITGP